MANSKNTIQNIPLTGQLCLNTLKTDVTQFEGYNEKNSTVFGGELTPLWKKETELGNKNNTVTLFNSKGKAFTFGKRDSYSNDVTITRKIELPSDAVWGAMFINYKDDFTYKYCQLCIKEDGKLYGRQSSDLDLINNQSFTLLLEDRVVPSNYRLEAASFFTNQISRGFKKYPYALLSYLAINTSQETSPYKIALGTISIGMETDTISATKLAAHDNLSAESLRPLSNFHPVLTDGRVFNESSYLIHCSNFSLGRSSSETDVLGDYYYFKVSVDLDENENLVWTVGELVDKSNDSVNEGYLRLRYAQYPGGPGMEFNWPTTNVDYQTWTANQSPYTLTMTVPSGGSSFSERPALCYRYYFPDSHGAGYSTSYKVTGHDGNGFIPGYETCTNWNQVYTLDGQLISINHGIPICTPTSITNSYFSYQHNNPPDDNIEAISSYSYQKLDGWYCTIVVGRKYLTDKDFMTYFKEGIIDNRYVWEKVGYKLFDIETETYVKDIQFAGFIPTNVPTFDSNYNDTESIGAIYCAGYNAGFALNGAKFVGFLSNPFVMTQCRAKGFKYDGNIVWGDWGNRAIGFGWEKHSTIQSYCSYGNNVQAAEYNGDDSAYFGTIYPIDTNGNTILPISLSSKIISGYSNNDLIVDENTAYPLIYYNNNQKIYGYYLLASIESVQGSFALQGQKYVFDENNIYSISIQNGVVSSVEAICYKKNMMFIGTLPQAAIFYSAFNKTFYQFTGDAILSKMFEASDINEIRFVGQNPSSLSLWICTDTGVYIMSDMDMFKLDYDAKDIYFEENKAILVTENETNWVENDISLYDIGNGATETPIKLHTKFYGVGAEQKVTYDCWYIRLHNKDHKAGKLKLKVNTITNTAFETEEKTYDIEPSMYDGNDTIFIRYQPKYQSAVATQLELESDIAIYQISLGVNTGDAVAQQSKFNF